MPITTKHKNFFGQVTIIENKSFTVSISTAREGIFKGLSTMISIGRYPNVTPFAKIIYESKCPSEGRHRSHDIIASNIVVGMEEFNRDLKSAIMTAVDSINSGSTPLFIAPLGIKESNFLCPIIKEVQTQRQK